MLLAVRVSSYGCTRVVWRALKKLELHSAILNIYIYIYMLALSSKEDDDDDDDRKRFLK